MSEIDGLIDRITDIAARKTVDMLKKEVFIIQEDRKSKNDKGPRMAYGLNGLAEYLRKSVTTVHRWEKDGKFEGCYRQIGSSFYFNLDMVDKMYSQWGESDK